MVQLTPLKLGIQTSFKIIWINIEFKIYVWTCSIYL